MSEHEENISTEDEVMIEVDFNEDPIYTETNKEELLEEIKQEIDEAGGVNHQLAVSLESICEGLITKRASLKSFTKDYSRTNYEITMEGIAEAGKWIKENIIQKILDFIKKITSWFANTFGTKEHAAAVENTVEKTKKTEEKKKETVEKAKKVFLSKDERIIRDSALFIEAFKADMEAGLNPDLFNKAGSVGQLLETILQEGLRFRLKEKISKNTYLILEKKSTHYQKIANSFYSTGFTYGTNLHLEMKAVEEAFNKKEEYQPRTMTLDKQNFWFAIKDISDLAVKGDLGDGAAMQKQFIAKTDAFVAKNTAFNPQENSLYDIDNGLDALAAVKSSELDKLRKTFLLLASETDSLKKTIDGHWGKPGDPAISYEEPIKNIKEECGFMISIILQVQKIEKDITSMMKNYCTALEQAMGSATKAFRAVAADDKLEPDFKQRLMDFIEQALRH